MRYLTFPPGHHLTLEPYGTLLETHHVFDEEHIEAINAALASQRALLVRGEPGIGKSQLARAAAAGLGRAFVPFTVDARTEARDLLYTVDLVARLAKAQILGHLQNTQDLDFEKEIGETRFTVPGPLWWVFGWESAETQAKETNAPAPKAPPGWKVNHGAVLLIDEIDKADPAVPNGLLEALGQGRFTAPGGEEVATTGSVPPLVVITTNEERALPDAFVRRCLVLQLGWPKDPRALTERLMARGEAHFPELSDEVRRKAAEMLVEDRGVVAERGVCPPGGAEYLDLLRVVATRWEGSEKKQLQALERIRRFALQKHPEEPGW